MHAGFGKQPAAVASHLTKMAWKNELITNYVGSDSCRVFIITSDGTMIAEEELKNANPNE